MKYHNFEEEIAKIYAKIALLEALFILQCAMDQYYCPKSTSASSLLCLYTSKKLAQLARKIAQMRQQRMHVYNYTLAEPIIMIILRIIIKVVKKLRYSANQIC